MPDGHCADPSLPLHLDQGRGSSKKESFSLRVSPALHPPERPSPRRADMAGHGHGSGNAGTEVYIIYISHIARVRMDTPGKVANLARGQPNRENGYFPVRVRA